MRFSRTNMRLAAARLPDLSREIDAQAAEFSITHFCPRNPGLTKSTTYARETAKIGRSLFKSSENRWHALGDRDRAVAARRDRLARQLLPIQVRPAPLFAGRSDPVRPRRPV